MSGRALSAGLPASPHPGRALLARIMKRIRNGALTVVLPDGAKLFARGASGGPEAVCVLHRWRALRRLVLGGDNDFAEAFLDGDWSSPDLVALLTFAAHNMAEIPGAEGGPWPVRLFHRAWHRLRANTRRGSRRNIMAHYDLGNEFYALWLDSGMSYSSALYRDPALSLEEAQAVKQDLVHEMLDITPGCALLEIGCGWGGLAERLAEAGARVTAITLSPAQETYAKMRLGGKARVLLQDYRDSKGVFDRIVSIEMIEAVGEAYWPAYFASLRRSLVDDGIAVIQAITIGDEWLPAYRRGVDFIQRYIFPGGMLPSPGEIARLAREHGFRIARHESFGASYAQTLAEWRARFHAAWPRIAALGFSPRFRRLWEYYLAYCEAGFLARRIDVGLWRLEKITT